MSFLDDLFNIQITAQVAPVTNPGFGVPLIVDANTRFIDRVRTYSSPDDMLTDGFTTSDAAYLAAVAICSQKPRVPQFKVGRRTNLPAMAATLTPTAANNQTYSVTVNGKVASYTSSGAATVAAITAGLKTAIDALAIAGLTTTDNGVAGLVLSVAAGGWFRLGAVNRSLLAVAQTHTDAGIAADLAAIALVDSDWYGFALTTSSAAEVLAAAAWAQANSKQYVQASQDTAIVTQAKAGATDIAAQIQNAGYTYAGVIFHGDNGEFAGLAWLGAVYSYDPGGVTFKFKLLSGVTPDNLNETEFGNVKDKAANYYVTIGGAGCTGEGVSGSGEFLDTVRDIDAMHFDMQTGVYNYVRANPKVAYTDRGLVGIHDAIDASLRRFTKNGFLSDDPAPTVTMPKVKDATTADKKARKVSGIQFNAEAAGAVHSASIKGNVSL